MSKKSKLLMKRKKKESAVERALSEYFVYQPEWPDLRPLTLAVWVALWFMAEGDSRIVAVSHRELCRPVRIKSKSTINIALAELKTKGYIRPIIPGTPILRKPCMYHLFRGPDGERELSIAEESIVWLLKVGRVEPAELRRENCF